MNITVTIRKDDFIPSKPWHADLETDDGVKLKSWQQFWRTKKAMIQEIKAVEPTAKIVVE